MVKQDREDKYNALLEMIDESEVKNCAYFGDDILDLGCMLPIKEAGGLVGCPADAVREVKETSDYICKNKAGDGALREFAEWVIARNSEKVQ
jgi:3-deoxy-D-manno-octulosonate 8-phosphate phosphatase (KDO 8-P phosphatase)